MQTTYDKDKGIIRAQLLLHIIKVISVLAGRRISSLLLCAFPLNFLSNEILVHLERLLDVNLELDDIVQHPLQFCVQLFSQCCRL